MVLARGNIELQKQIFNASSPRYNYVQVRSPKLPHTPKPASLTPRVGHLHAVSVLEASQAAAAQSEADAADAEQLSRRESNSLASSSNGTSFYEGAGPGTSEIPADPSDPLAAEIFACDEIDDVMEIVGDEVDIMSATSLAAALKKISSMCKLKGTTSKQKGKEQIASLAKSEDFSLLLTFILEKSYEMSSTGITDCLWALATMNMRVPRVTRHLQREVEARLGGLSERDMATAVWSFATLRHNPGALLDQLADAALPRLAAFEPQGLSMMLWAYSKLEHPPAPEFIEQTLLHFDQNLSSFSNQSVANIVYALGKLKQSLPPDTCSRVEELLVTAEDLQPFNDVELANILYGFVRMSYQAPKLVALLEKRIAVKSLVESSASMVWASLVWGAASLGLNIQPQTLDFLQQWGLEDLQSYTPSSLCNLAWGLAILGEVKHPVFLEVVNAAVSSHQKRTLEPRLMRQLFQAVASARVLGATVDIPQDLEQLAYKWWRKGSLSKSMSMSHEAVAKAIKKLDLESASQHNAGYGLPIVDVAIESDPQDIALMVLPPAEYAINPGQPQPLGRIKSASRLLEAAGWRVVNLPASSLRKISSERAVLRAVGKLMQELGITTDWQKAAQAAPKSVPKSIESNRQRWAEDEEPLIAKAEPIQRKSSQSAAGGKTAVIALSDSSDSDDQPDESPSEVMPAADLKSIETQEEKLLRARQRRAQVAEAMKGDFMEDWLSLSDWKAQKKVIPARRNEGS